MPPRVRLNATLPDSEQSNALESTLDHAISAPLEPVVAVVVLAVDRIIRDVHSGGSVVVYRLERIETLNGDDATAGRELADTAVEDRLGVVRLPFPQLVEPVEP